MANELNIQLDPFVYTGLTLLAKVYASDGVQQGVTTTLSEVASGLYSGNFTTTPLITGQYSVRFETNIPNKFYGTGVLNILNGKEVTPLKYAQRKDIIPSLI